MGIIHRGPTSEDLFTDEGALTYSIGTASASLQSAMSAPLPPEMVSVAAATTAADIVANDLVYLNAHVSTVTLSGATAETTSILSELGTACDAALAVEDYATPEDLGTALQPCQDAMSWIRCNIDASPTSLGTVCPDATDTALWQQRFVEMNAAYVSLNGDTWLYPVSFGIASLAPTMAAGTAAGAASLQTALTGAAVPLDLGVANYLAAFDVASYEGVQTVGYVSGYSSVPGYALFATSAASAAGWMIDDDMMTRQQGFAVIEDLYADPSVDLGTKLYIESIEYQSGVIE